MSSSSTPTRNPTPNPTALIAVGMDIGSSHSRVAIGDATNSTSSTASATSSRVVSNTLGHRSTLSLVALEKNDSSETNNTTTSLEDDGTHVFGEAALRLWQKEHTSHGTAGPPSVRDMLSSDTTAAAAQAFLHHLASLASDATSTPVEQLRLVLSVPVDATNDYFETLISVTEQALLLQQQQNNATIKKKKKLTHANVRVLGVVSDPAAVCIAHGLTDTNNNNNKKSNYSNVLVLDGGASGLTVSHLTSSGGTSSAASGGALWSLVHFQRLTQVSGPALVTLLAQHVASQFERKYRFPASVVWESKKARIKLLQACETALQSMSTSTNSVHITIDGLYEGMDCHIPLSKPRWDMLTGSLLKQVETLLIPYQQQSIDVVLVAGSVASLMTPLVDKLFPTVYRGIPKIAPEEAIALGCARHAMSLLQHETRHTHPTHTIPVSPIAIGIGKNDNLQTVIPKGMPLPAHVIHNIQVVESTEIAVWQLLPTKKIVAHLQDLPIDTNVEVLVELTSKGQLSIAVQGGQLVTVS